MTKRYTAADFANARFAEHENGQLATRDTGDPDYPWGTTYDALHDLDMAQDGWVPVPTKQQLTECDYADYVDHLGLGELTLEEILADFCIEIIPDPEPTDEELLAGIIRGIDDWQSITSPELLAKYLNTAGVTVDKEDN